MYWSFPGGKSPAKQRPNPAFERANTGISMVHGKHMPVPDCGPNRSFKRGLRADGGHEPVHRRKFLFATAALLATSLAHGQQMERVRRIGYLSSEVAESEPGRRNQRLLRESLRRVGYEEGRNLTIDLRGESIGP